jgi:hypothetical protein
MYKIRNLIVLFGAVLILAVLATSGMITSTQSAKASDSYQYNGMGELRRFESQQEELMGAASSGFGDLRRFEAREVIPITGAPQSGRALTGMGELRLIEKNQAPNSGMGELRRFEARQ